MSGRHFSIPEVVVFEQAHSTVYLRGRIAGGGGGGGGVGDEGTVERDLFAHADPLTVCMGKWPVSTGGRRGREGRTRIPSFLLVPLLCGPSDSHREKHQQRPPSGKRGNERMRGARGAGRRRTLLSPSMTHSPFIISGQTYQSV